MFEDYINMVRGMIAAMVTSAQIGHKQTETLLADNAAERERHWKQVEREEAHAKTEIARVSAEAAAQTAALNKIGDALGRIATALEADKP